MLVAQPALKFKVDAEKEQVGESAKFQGEWREKKTLLVPVRVQWGAPVHVVSASLLCEQFSTSLCSSLSFHLETTRGAAHVHWWASDTKIPLSHR